MADMKYFIKNIIFIFTNDVHKKISEYVDISGIFCYNIAVDSVR